MIISLPKIKTGLQLSPLQMTLALIWIAQLAAIVGVKSGFESWFLEKTPFNLLFLNAILILSIKENKGLKYGLFAAFALFGFAVEWIGVNTGILFGNYSYGSNLGVQFSGVPLIIGLNWAMLIFICGLIGLSIKTNRVFQIGISLMLLLLLDLVMEQSAPRFQFWQFEAGIVPLKNYLCWALVSLPMLVIFNRFYQQENALSLSANLYGSQLFFFACFVLNF